MDATSRYGGVLINDGECDALDVLDHELGDAVAFGHGELTVGIRVDQQDLDFASISRVDQAW